jgi:rRNA maturation endonuclease Nob1
MKTTERVHVCKNCESIVDVDDASRCSFCGTPALVMPRNTASSIIWNENIERMMRWCKAGRIMPDAEGGK